MKISGSRLRGHEYSYRSTVMEKGASPKWTNAFANEDEMIAVANGILARQKTRCDVRQVIEKIRTGEHFFFDLDLTRREAETLGWQPATRD